MISARHDGPMTAFFVFVGLALALGILSVRYGADSRIDRPGRQL